MFQKMKKRLKNEKGLTLVELLAVIVILGIVAAIAVPAIGNIVDNSRLNAVKADAMNILNAANIYFTENPDDTWVTTGWLKHEGFIDSPGKIPTGTETTKPSTAPTEFTGNSLIEKGTDGVQITTGNINVGGGNLVKFSDATINDITTNATKGSDLSSTVTTIQ